MDAKRVGAVGRILQNLRHRSFEEAAFDSRQAGVDQVARRAALEENNDTVYARDTLSLGGHGSDADILDNVSFSHCSKSAKLRNPGVFRLWAICYL